jgi:hypothetical protein
MSIGFQERSIWGLSPAAVLSSEKEAFLNLLERRSTDLYPRYVVVSAVRR